MARPLSGKFSFLRPETAVQTTKPNGNELPKKALKGLLFWAGKPQVKDNPAQGKAAQGYGYGTGRFPDRQTKAPSNGGGRTAGLAHK